MTLAEGRWLVLASADATVAAGDELTAVNGTPTPQLVAQLLPYLRADGSSDGKRLRQLGQDRDDYSQVAVSVAACTLATRQERLLRQGRPPVEDRWTFEVKD
ncbi:MAG: hypothetical protein IPP58_15225 [Holophagaceae bacterium]|uniref:PDZ domain-containing protein n=1 Tax=Candidatus Geothrix skivensis TaxID=2954439 RepID=A0A9D7SL26_9BACT|nr:hypothetical protein [Candidatus Geothrix skivensis]